MLLILLDATGSDLPSLEPPFFSPSTGGGILVRCAGFWNFSHYSLNNNKTLFNISKQYVHVITIPYIYSMFYLQRVGVEILRGL